jgi:aryl-phospho-beta-D-glucosidase BglC (GH1 family)
VKLAGVNWYGASDVKYVAGGLDKVPAAQVSKTIHDLGFNVVRLPFSNAMLHVTSPVAPGDVAGNPTLVGKTPIEVYDAVVDALTTEGLFVILNNHTTHAMWCCGYDADGLWFTSDYTEEQWIEDWEMLATRYASNLRVIGADLRNELRPAMTNGSIVPTFVNWGQGGTGDWAAAATRAGNRVLAKNPNLIVVVEGISSADDLTGVAAHPVVLSVPNKLAYEAHQYGFFPSPPEDTSMPYSGMDAATLASASHTKWGYIMDPGQPYTAPVWLGEFGDSGESTWMSNLGANMTQLDQDYAYWAINGGPKPSGDEEPYGLLQDDWTTVNMDGRLTMLQSLQKATRGPGVGGPGDACP